MKDQIIKASTCRSYGRNVLHVMLVGAAGLPCIISLAVIFGCAIVWITQDFDLSGPDNDFIMVLIIFADILLSLSALLVGVMLRYSSWSKAPKASLMVSILVASGSMFATVMFSTVFKVMDLEGLYILILLGGFGAMVGALPRFLHWKMSEEDGS